MASLPLFVTCILSSASHRNSFEAAWLDHGQQRTGNLRASASEKARVLAVNNSIQTQAQASPSLNVSATQGEETEGENGHWTSSVVSGSGPCSCSSAPQADNVGVHDYDGIGVMTEYPDASSSGTYSGTSEVNGQKLQVETGEVGLWSVVIPTYNRLPILTKCLQALEEQVDYKLGGIARYEVIVVDDGSTDGTVEFLSGERADVYKDDSETMALIEAEKDSPKVKGEKPNMEGEVLQSDVQGSAARQSKRFPHVKFVRQKHAGATTARNLGLKHASGAIILFVDSDLVVTRSFLRAHGEALGEAFGEDGDDRAFTYGRVINTSNFENPWSEKVKVTDYSAAFFATGNVAISRRRLMEAGKLLGPDVDGPFDAVFSEYGWEDLELGVRLKQLGARIKHAPDAVGYHWHPAFSVDQLPKLIEQEQLVRTWLRKGPDRIGGKEGKEINCFLQRYLRKTVLREKQRGRNGVRFYQKHPNLNVQLMIQMTPFHELLWFVLTLGGLLNEKTMEPLLRQLEMKDMNQIAAALVRPVLNWHTVQAVKEEAERLKVK